MRQQSKKEIEEGTGIVLMCLRLYLPQQYPTRLNHQEALMAHPTEVDWQIMFFKAACG